MPEDAGRGLSGKTRLLLEDTEAAPAGILVTVVARDGSSRTVKPVDGGPEFQVEERQLRGDDDGDEATDA